MKQLLQSLKTGDLSLIEVPSPLASENHVLIKTRCSLISSGTERMLMDFGKATIFGKIKQQPEKVAQVFDKIRTDGLVTTLEAVQAKLDQPIPLGYCNVGTVLENTNGARHFQVGDRVISNGAHAEVVCVPKNLCVKIPEVVDDESATFAVLGAIALQGIRLIKPDLGECVVVIGLGLIGQLAVQLLIAQGCRVLGIDFDERRCVLAKSFGADVFCVNENNNSVDYAMAFSRYRGVDAVLITASTDSNQPIQQAAHMCRQRGRIVLIGVVGLQLSREDFYKKEITFQVSCSYGPGRYDPHYEQKGNDYPVGFVRWTENRNIEAVLDMMAMGKITIAPLITHRFIFFEAVAAYRVLDDRDALGILLKYATEKQEKVSDNFTDTCPNNTEKSIIVGCAGAGNFASRILLPQFKKQPVFLDTLVSKNGVTAAIYAKKNGFLQASCQFSDLIKNKKINTVIIVTPHHLHADQIILALQAGKHVYVEKPLAITIEQLDRVVETYNSLKTKPVVMIGFNRRFSPLVVKMKALLSDLVEPKNIVMMVNAKFIPKEHWTQDNDIGGGRLIGEACHFIDLVRFIADSPIAHVSISNLQSDKYCKNENFTVTLTFENGSMGAVHYFANGHTRFPKERLEVFCAGKILQLDNFRKLNTFGFRQSGKLFSWRQQKGYSEAIDAFVSAVTHGLPSPILFSEIVETTRACLQCHESD
ncbi:MAG: bi-domain-containing oxidoreductase [Coxiellaceae bacterium]|nr:bi-domain-containing oxidoreductase [Coxiellaceae bacterium]